MTRSWLNWRGDASRNAVLELGRRPALPFQNLPAKEPLVLVEALRPNWLHRGERVEVHKRYKVPASAAMSLEFSGKARRVE